MSELADPRNWYAPAPHGEGYLFTDPLTRQRLDPNEIPSWLTSDLVLEMGVDELMTRGTSLSVDLLFHRHKYASDLGNVTEAWFEQRVARADYYATEAFGQRRALQAQNLQRMVNFMTVYGAGPQTQANLEHISRRVYQLPYNVRQVRAAHMGNTPTFNVDITSDETDTEQAILYAKKLLHQEQFEHGMGIDIDEGRAAYVALQNAREWVAVARAGLEVAARETVERPLDLFITFGGSHKDLERKFRLLGSHVTSVLLVPEDGELAAVPLDTMIANCAVTPADLATMRAAVAADQAKQ